MKIYCYRDLLIGERVAQAEYLNFGVTHYFIEGTRGDETAPRTGISAIFAIVERLAGHITEARRFPTGKQIEKLLLHSDPIVAFVQMCISAGTGKTRCYFDARAAGLKIRKQTALALYEYLQLEEAMKVPQNVSTVSSTAFYESVQDYFEDQFARDEFFSRFDYQRADMSKCTADDINSADTDAIAPGDYIFEMGELDSATLKYYGHYRAATRRIVARIYEDFYLPGLQSLLRSHDNAQD